MAKKARRLDAEAGVMVDGRPEQLRIGQFWNFRKNGEPNIIREIHELCAETPGPHIHLIAMDGPLCLSFSRYHTTYNPRHASIMATMERIWGPGRQGFPGTVTGRLSAGRPEMQEVKA